MAFLGDGMGKAHENAMLMKMGKRPLDGVKPRGDCFNVGWGRDLHPSQAVDLLPGRRRVAKQPVAAAGTAAFMPAPAPLAQDLRHSGPTSSSGQHASGQEGERRLQHW